jgi:hypothetical protein
LGPNADFAAELVLDVSAHYAAGKLTLAAVTDRQAGKIARS